MMFDRLRAAGALLAGLAGLLSYAPRSAACQLLQIAELPVTLAPDGPVTDGAVNGKPVKILADTGAMTSLVWRSEAERLGLKLSNVVGVEMYGAGGRSRVQHTTIDEFKLGKHTVHGFSLLAAGERPVGRNAFSVLLGADFFSQVDVELDLGHGAIRLLRPVGCHGSQIVYWTQRFSEADMAPPRPDSPRFAVTVLLNGNRVSAMIDSGAATSVINEPAARNAGGTIVDAHALRFQGLGAAPVQSKLARFETFAFGDETIRNPELEVTDGLITGRATETGSRLAEASPDDPELLLGDDFLLAHRLLISSSQGKIYFTYEGGAPFHSPRPSSATQAAPAGLGKGSEAH